MIVRKIDNIYIVDWAGKIVECSLSYPWSKPQSNVVIHFTGNQNGHRLHQNYTELILQGSLFQQLKLHSYLRCIYLFPDNYSAIKISFCEDRGSRNGSSSGQNPAIRSVQKHVRNLRMPAMSQ